MLNTHNLNSEQKKAVETTEGPLLILAGAGAGKTKTITYRILNLIKKGVAPNSILAVTFTNKSASEMRERVIKLIEEDPELNLPISFAERPFVSTFHALGVHIIKREAVHLNLPRHFTIFDRSDSLSAIKDAVKTLSLDPKQFEPAKFLGIISRKKGDGISLQEYETVATDNYIDRLLLSIWQHYEKKLREEKALDFDDLLLKTKNLLRDHKEIRESYQKMWRYIHIDEYQDTNRVQYEIAKLLAGESHNICVVGDIDQSIYSWRGADFKNIMRFEKDYQGTKTILLEQNYRSSKTILKAANMVIEKNTLRKDKNLFTENEEGEKILLHGAYDEVHEAEYIANKASELIASGIEPSEIAVLYRANFQSRILEEKFLGYNLPYQVLGVRFFERKEVREMISYLQAAFSPDSTSDIKRTINTPPRGIGKTTLLKIFASDEKSLPSNTKAKIENYRSMLRRIKDVALSKPLSETLNFIIEESGLKQYYEEMGSDGEERLENMYELVAVGSKYDMFPCEEAVEKFLTDAALASDQDDLNEKKDGVRLMTVHASKGLEFDYVFISGLEEDLFPHGRPDGGKKNVEESEEERRLFYVAITRARKKLFLTYASIRSMFGNRMINAPSSFIEDLTPEILESEFGETDNYHGKVIYLED
jgi:DNA helicase-2/ATP-dependent DNA helicase PcrA